MRALLWSICVFGYLLIGVACSEKKPSPEPPPPDCSTADALQITTESETVIIFPNQPAHVTLDVQAAMTGQTTPEDGVGRVYIDLTSDGVFEINTTESSVTVTLDTPREYPVQITSARCDGSGLLVSRLRLFARSVSFPGLQVTVSPDPAAPVRVNTFMSAAVKLVAAVDAVPIQLKIWWQDGVEEEATIQTPVQEYTSFHTYTQTGLYTLRVTATDSYGLQSTANIDVVSTALTENKFRLDFGRTLNDFQLFYPLESSQPHVVQAGGSSGVILLRAENDVLEIAGRNKLSATFTRNVLAVAVDDANDIVYVAAEDDGLYILDVTNPVAPRTLFPEVFQPPQVGALVDQVWTCTAPARAYFRNFGDGIYGIELTSKTVLTMLRQDPDLGVSPWRFMRAVTTDSGTPLLHLPHPQALDVTCLGSRYVSVLDADAVYIYDLQPFFGTEQVPALISQFVPDLDLEQPEIVLADFDYATVSSTSSFETTMAVAIRENGSAEYRLRVSDGVATHAFQRHRKTLRAGSTLSGGDFVPEPHVQVAVSGQRTVTLIDGLQDADAHYVFSNTTAPEATTERVLYTASNRCTPDSGAFEEKKSCFVGPGAENLRIPGQFLYEYWFQSQTGIHRFTTTSPFALTSYVLPIQPSALVITADDYQVLAEKRFYLYDRAEVEQQQFGARQAAPTSTLDVAFAPYRVEPRVASNNHVLVGFGALAWLDATTTPVLTANKTIQFGVRDIAVDPYNGRALVIDSAAQRVRVLEPGAGTAQVVYTSEDAPYWRPAGCASNLFVWQAQDDQRVIYRYKSTTFSLESFIVGPLRAFTALGCSISTLAVVDGPFYGFLEMTLFDLDDRSLESVTRLPFIGNESLENINVLIQDSVLVIQAQNRGVLAYDISNPQSPRLLIGDYFADMANATGFSLWSGGGEVRYGGLAPNSNGQPPLIVVKGAAISP